MKKAVISTGGKQYLVSEGESISVERIKDATESLAFDALMVIDGDKISIGAPVVSGVSVKATIVDGEARSAKVTAIRYKAKKRVHKVHGHRQLQTIIKIDKIV